MGFTTFDYQTDLLYLEGMEKGEERGIQKNAIYGIIKMTETKIANSLIAEYLGVKLAFVKSIQKDLLQKDEIIQLLQKGEPIEIIAKRLKVNALLVEVLSDELKSSNKKVD